MRNQNYGQANRSTPYNTGGKLYFVATSLPSEDAAF